MVAGDVPVMPWQNNECGSPPHVSDDSLKSCSGPYFFFFLPLLTASAKQW